MKYPYYIEQHLEEINSIVSSWPVEKEINEVIRWMLQFDKNDYDLALRIIKNLNVIGHKDLNTGLATAYSKLKRFAQYKEKISQDNTLFATIGGAAKSGAMVAYNFRLTADLSDQNFLDDNSIKYLTAGKIDNIILVDDIISTGDQAKKEILELTDYVVPLGVKNIYILTAVSMEEGIKSIEENTTAKVFSAFIYNHNDTVKSINSKFYDGVPIDQRELLKNRLLSYTNLGYGGIGSLIVFFYNTPNSTIPLIWLDKNSWFPLFKRISPVAGIDRYYKDLEQAPAPKKTKADASELTIFVEGSVEEKFLESIKSKIIEKTGYKKISIIALMAGFYSKPLIDNLHKLSNHYIFIIEKEASSENRFTSRVLENLKDKPFIFIGNVMEYFDMNKLREDVTWGKLLAPIENADDDDYKRALRRRFFSRIIRQDGEFVRLSNLYINDFTANQLIEEIDQKLKQYFAATPAE